MLAMIDLRVIVGGRIGTQGSAISSAVNRRSPHRLVVAVRCVVVTHAGSGVIRRIEVARRSPIREAPSHACLAATGRALDLSGPPRLRG
jgi:hypothetical protein